MIKTYQNALRNLMDELGISLYKTSTKGCQENYYIPARRKVQELLELIKDNPYQNPPPYEKLIGNLVGAYSRRINI